MLEHGISSWPSWGMSDTGKIPPKGKASPWVCFSCFVWPAPPRNTARSLTADTHGSFLMFTWIGNRDNLGLIAQMLLQNGMQVNQDPATSKEVHCHLLSVTDALTEHNWAWGSVDTSVLIGIGNMWNDDWGKQRKRPALKRLPEIRLLFQTHFHREAYAASRSSLLILKLILMCGVPEEAIVKREKEEKETEKPGQMKNIVRLYDRFFEPRQSGQKATSLNKQVSLKKTAKAALQKITDHSPSNTHCWGCSAYGL